MPPLAAAVTAIALLSGCQTYRQSKITAVAGGVTTIGGVALVGAGFATCPIAVDCGGDTGTAEALLVAGGALVMLGLPLIVFGLAGMAANDE